MTRTVFERPTIGLLVAPASGRMPPDADKLYDEREVQFVTEGLGVGEISPSGFDEAEARILEKARRLRDAGAQCIILMGTSLTFYRGPSYTDDLRDEMQAITGVPCTTMSHAIVDSMRVLGMKRVAVATSYIDELNAALENYLNQTGFDVQTVQGLGIRGVDAMRAVSAQALIDLSCKAIEASANPDGLLISCTGLKTLGLHAQLEETFNVPVTSSAPAGIWHVMRLAGLDVDKPEYGALFSLGREADGAVTGSRQRAQRVAQGQR